MMKVCVSLISLTIELDLNVSWIIFKNRKIGYRKSEILALKSELEAEQKAKKAKEKPDKFYFCPDPIAYSPF